MKTYQIFIVFLISMLTFSGCRKMDNLLPASEIILQDSVTQFGITWYFDKTYQTGQFANGDWWVVGPITIVGINPPSTMEGNRIINGSMINPSPKNGNVQGYDNAMYANTYNPELNAARPEAVNLSIVNPLEVSIHSSIISCISIPEPESNPQLKTAAILTVLETVPPKGSFRPPYCGSDKSIEHNTAQIQTTLLRSLEPVKETPSITEVERLFERPWIDHIPDWSSGAQHPTENMQGYGREIANDVGIGALMLHLDIPYTEKQTLLIRYIQLGIDLYGILLDGGEKNWIPNGGHASGRKWPVLFAGLMLNDNDMKSIGQKSGDYLFTDGHGPDNVPADYIHFGEDGQTFFVTWEDIERELQPNWEEIKGVPYIDTDLGMPEWGIRHSVDPFIDNKDWDAAYRRCCTANAWSGYILAAHIMNAKKLWNHDALFGYQDRFMDFEEPQSWTRCWDDFCESMWDTYRKNYDL